MSRLNSLFEEDILMQDAIEDFDGMTDDTEDIIIGVIEDRAKDTKPHLFVNDQDVNDEDQETVDQLLAMSDDDSDADLVDDEDDEVLTPEEEKEFLDDILDDDDEF